MDRLLVQAATLAFFTATLVGCGGGTNGGGGSTTLQTTSTTTGSSKYPANPFCSKSASAKRRQDSLPIGSPIGWHPTDQTVGKGWCAGQVPEKSWHLNDFCGNSDANSAKQGPQVKVLTYNLYWWNLFGQQKGAHGSAGKNIAKFAQDQPYDLMGFQECENISWPLVDAKGAGMKGEFTTIVGDHAVAMAFRTETFDKLDAGEADVADDQAGTHYYSRRIAQWVRLNHKASGKKVFFMNHHGPTPPATGGACGNQATAYNLLKVIGENAKVGDAVIFVGDFNAPWLMPSQGHGTLQWLEEAGYLDCHIPHIFANPVVDDMWGIDNFFSSCTNLVSTTVMPKGGSDHNALNAVFELLGPSMENRSSHGEPATLIF